MRQMIFGASIAYVVLLGGASAHEFKLGNLVVEHPWSRQTPPKAPVGVGYLKITNLGAEPDRLIGGSSEVARGFEVHTSDQTDGVMRMRRLEEGVPIGPGETVELKPLGTHIMLTGLTGPILRDKPFAGTLVFEHAGTLAVTYAVQSMGAREPAANSHNGHTR